MRINSNNYPLVSVIINCYNGEIYLAEAIKSLLLQTYKNFEVIFWDNQSHDNSAYIYKQFYKISFVSDYFISDIFSYIC